VSLAALFVAAATSGLQPPSAAAEPRLDVAGSVRLRWEGTDGAFFGRSGPPAQTVLMTRMLADADARTSRGLRAFVQLGWHDEADREGGSAPTDKNQLDMQQAFVDIPLSGLTLLRLGRQELVLGSARLVGVRDSPNIRLAFDGANIDSRFTGTLDGWSLRAFALRPVEIRPGAFDDRADRRMSLSGVYATRAPTLDRPLGLDVYALRTERRQAIYAIGAGREDRWTFGARVFGRRGLFDWNIEPMVQTGSFRGDAIRAWTVASDIGWRPAGGPFDTRLGLKANITSGDSDPTDRRLQTFSAPFPRFTYFSEAATIAPQNHIDLQPDVSFAFGRQLTVRAGVDLFWRTQTNDAIYRVPGVPVRGSQTAQSRATGRQWETELRWAMRPDVELRASLVHWRPGAGLRSNGAEAVSFGMVQMTWRSIR
jgi:hypothetical protein